MTGAEVPRRAKQRPTGTLAIQGPGLSQGGFAAVGKARFAPVTAADILAGMNFSVTEFHLPDGPDEQ